MLDKSWGLLVIPALGRSGMGAVTHSAEVTCTFSFLKGICLPGIFGLRFTKLAVWMFVQMSERREKLPVLPAKSKDWLYRLRQCPPRVSVEAQLKERTCHAVKKLRGPWGVGRWVGQDLLRQEAWRRGGLLAQGAVWWMELDGLWAGPRCPVSESSFFLASYPVPCGDKFLPCVKYTNIFLAMKCTFLFQLNHDFKYKKFIDC